MNRRKRHKAKQKEKRNAERRARKALNAWADRFATECVEYESQPDDQSGPPITRGDLTREFLKSREPPA